MVMVPREEVGEGGGASDPMYVYHCHCGSVTLCIMAYILHSEDRAVTTKIYSGEPFGFRGGYATAPRGISGSQSNSTKKTR
jgi:hypothetical protein